MGGDVLRAHLEEVSHAGDLTAAHPVLRRPWQAGRSVGPGTSIVRVAAVCTPRRTSRIILPDRRGRDRLARGCRPGSRHALIAPGRSARRGRRNEAPMKRAGPNTTERPANGRGAHAGTSEHQSLSKYIQARFDECSRSQKDVAQYIVDHLDEAAFPDRRGGFATRQHVELDRGVLLPGARIRGLPRLPGRRAREEYRRVNAQGGKDEGPGGATPLFALDQTEFESALVADHMNVEDTARKISRGSVQALIDAIVAAEKILVAGTDQMAFFASYMRHLLMLLDLRVNVVASPSQEALSRLGRIDEATLVVGLSAGRPHPLVVRAMKLGRHRQAKAAAITDATLSEVAKLAHIKLYYSSNSPAYVRSHTALLSVIQALAYGVYALDSAQYDDRIKAFRLK